MCTDTCESTVVYRLFNPHNKDTILYGRAPNLFDRKKSYVKGFKFSKQVSMFLRRRLTTGTRSVTQSVIHRVQLPSSTPLTGVPLREDDLSGHLPLVYSFIEFDFMWMYLCNPFPTIPYLPRHYLFLQWPSVRIRPFGTSPLTFLFLGLCVSLDAVTSIEAPPVLGLWPSSCHSDLLTCGDLFPFLPFLYGIRSNRPRDSTAESIRPRSRNLKRVFITLRELSEIRLPLN